MTLMHRQRGMSLLMVLVVLGISLVGALALLRSTEVSALVAGNVSFREAATQATDIGISQGAKALDATTNFDINVANAYFATRQPEDASGLPTSVNWATVPASTVGYYQVQHVVERLCQALPKDDPAANCMIRDGEAPGSNKAGSLVYKSPASVYYRITVRVMGPKQTAAFVQALVVK